MKKYLIILCASIVFINSKPEQTVFKRALACLASIAKTPEQSKAEEANEFLNLIELRKMLAEPKNNLPYLLKLQSLLCEINQTELTNKEFKAANDQMIILDAVQRANAESERLCEPEDVNTPNHLNLSKNEMIGLGAAVFGAASLLGYVIYSKYKSKEAAKQKRYSVQNVKS